MSNEIINCFNGKQCVYDNTCPMYNAALGICRLEPLKTYRVEGISPKQEPTPKPKPTRPQKPAEKEPSTFKVGELTDVTGTLLDDGTIKTGTRPDGTEWVRNSFRINADGMPIRVTLWGKLANDWASLHKDDEVTLKNMAVKEYKGVLQLNSVTTTDVTLH